MSIFSTRQMDANSSYLVSSPHSQCAMAALNDVRQYLSVEGGQVAVSSQQLSAASITGVLMDSWFSCSCFRSLMPQTQPEKEEGRLSSLRNRTGSRC